MSVAIATAGYVCPPGAGSITNVVDVQEQIAGSIVEQEDLAGSIVEQEDLAGFIVEDC